MYADFTVLIPTDKGRITKKTIRGTTYVYYQLERIYDPEHRYSVPKSTPIGKVCKEDSERMIPNEKYVLYYPDAEIPEKKNGYVRSSCLRSGTYIVLRKLIAEYRLEEFLRDIVGKEVGLFLDLVIYSIITENSAGQYYPDYAYDHPLFTKGMKVYSDSKVSDFINNLTTNQRVEFLNRWNSKRDHREKIYISYDSTNKNCQAGDIDCVEFGHAKEDASKPIINYSIAYDRNNNEPLFYEMYPGSIVDVSQLQYMLEKASTYGYKKAGFILDRGYFSKANIRFMDRNGYEFVIMMRGMKSLVKELVLANKGTFEEDRSSSIRSYHVSGKTVKQKLFESDEKDRYFHIYYNGKKQISEREQFEEKIDQMASYLKAQEGKQGFEMPSSMTKYFEPIYHGEGDEKTFVVAMEKTDAINDEIKLCGYFVIITSEKMNAEDAIDLYKSRDASEKLFKGDKSYLGNRSFRVHSSESARNKLFIEFVALILRNRFYTKLKAQMQQNDRRDNYMTVPAAIRELEKIELIRGADGNYRLDHAVTKNQKEILKAFDLTERGVREQMIGINNELQMLI